MSPGVKKGISIGLFILISLISMMYVFMPGIMPKGESGQFWFGISSAIIPAGLLSIAYLPDFKDTKVIYFLVFPYILALMGLFSAHDKTVRPRTITILSMWAAMILFIHGIDILLDRDEKIFDSQPKKSAAIAGIFILLVAIMYRQYSKIPVANFMREQMTQRQPRAPQRSSTQ